MNINRSRIPHYFQSIQHQFWAFFFITTLFYFYLNFAIKYCRILILHVLCFFSPPISQFGFRIRHAFILVLIRKSCRLGCFCSCGNVQIYSPTKIDVFIRIIDQDEISELITIKTRFGVVVHAIYIPFTNLVYWYENTNKTILQLCKLNQIMYFLSWWHHCIQPQQCFHVNDQR
jgi:hypothetical protein